MLQKINNVRAMLLNGGDVWWDLDNAQYIVPKVEPGQPEVSSIFAGAANSFIFNRYHASIFCILDKLHYKSPRSKKNLFNKCIHKSRNVINL